MLLIRHDKIEWGIEALLVQLDENRISKPCSPNLT